jgi:hypothetical protein
LKSILYGYWIASRSFEVARCNPAASENNKQKQAYSEKFSANAGAVAVSLTMGRAMWRTRLPGQRNHACISGAGTTNILAVTVLATAVREAAARSCPDGL